MSNFFDAPGPKSMVGIDDGVVGASSKEIYDTTIRHDPEL